MKRNLFYILPMLLLATSMNAQTLIWDDFDAYTLGALGPQAAHWTTWTPGSASEEGIVSNDVAYSGSNSLRICCNGGPTDVLLLLGNKTSGHYRLEFKLYVGEGTAAYFNHQKDETAPGSFWGQEVYMESDGTGSIDAGAPDTAQFTFRHGVWINVIQFFDLDNDRTTLIIDNEFVHSWPFNESSQGTSNGTIQLGAFDFYARNTGAHLFYVDDVRFTQLPSLSSIGAVAKLSVDMTKLIADGGTVSANGVHVAGTFNNWTPDSTMMMDNGDSSFTQFVHLEQFTTHNYKFINGDAWGDDETVPMDCGFNDGSGNINRGFDVFFMDTVMTEVCFGACVACDSLATSTENVFFSKSLSLYPNPTTSVTNLEYHFDMPTDLNIRVMNLIGQVLQEKQLRNVVEGITKVNMQSYSDGLYLIRVSDGVRVTTRKLLLRD